MPINFTQLFKDSWNFLQNQRKFTFSFVGIFMLLSAAVGLIQQAMLPAIENADAMSDEQRLEVLLQQSNSTDIFWFTLLKMFLMLFLTFWGTTAVHQISQRQYQGLGQSAGRTFTRLFGALLLTIICFFPFFVGIISVLSTFLQTVAGGQASGFSSIIGLFLIIIGVLTLIRLCLSPIRYLIDEQESIKSAVQNTLKFSNKRTSTLFFYCVISYLFFPLVAFQLAVLAQNIILSAVALLVMSLINVFSIVFTYRFYVIFNQKASAL
ncbi:hypothetical protein A4G18_08725 [Pasteurellaceae bacterium Pebbles2]|nr:hypothetical protein [Pasteurellaceae bacterium Pebbles2]